MFTTLRATYEDTWRDSEEPDSDPCEERGYTSVRNPWGGLKSAVPDGLVGADFLAWRDENADAERVTLLEAARIVADFPGRAWDWEYYYEPGVTRSFEECVDYAEQRYRQVCLHVDGNELAVFALADLISAGVDL